MTHPEPQHRFAALVTGASGFIGRCLVAALVLRGETVVSFGRGKQDPVLANTHHVQGDLEKPETLTNVCTDISTVFHLAGNAHSVDEATGRVDRHRDVTQNGTAALLNVAAAAGVTRFIFISSVKAGGEGGSTTLDESSPNVPTTPYGYSRLRAEQAVIEVGRQCGMHVCNLRLAMVYGVGMKGNLPRMLEAIDRGRFPPLPDTNNKRSMVAVEDVVQAALLAAKKPEANGKTYIVTDAEVYSTRRIFEAICLALNKPIPHWTIPIVALKAAAKLGDTIGRLRDKRFIFDSQALEKLTGSAYYSSAKIAHELGFHPTKKLEDLLPQIVSDYRARGIIRR